MSEPENPRLEEDEDSDPIWVTIGDQEVDLIDEVEEIIWEEEVSDDFSDDLLDPESITVTLYDGTVLSAFKDELSAEDLQKLHEYVNPD
ncbi:hypothetical protein [Chroococcidiopsis sp. CCMEE 29]|uniref:hypothetical protein n=1 Tax=Chroococcidiopsis sp. CCMEE 29 TaxID=155894 RepID=UPI0020226EA1|nr:hypothetical protein [Chroococcidiopsis sp. CCMEE 29]